MMADLGSVDRALIVAEARSWIGTPYRHQGSLKGAGCDCLGLGRGVWRAIYGSEPETPGPYTASWAEETGIETMRDAARRHMRELDADALRAGAPFAIGSVLLVRMKDRGLAKHAAIASAGEAIIHAYNGHAVMEMP